jgi:suppressor for copper-sensitivity B
MSKFLPIIFAFIAFIPNAWAAESPWASADQVRARILSGDHKAAVEVDLPEGWHSYWRVPGDAGLSPVFDWKESENVKEIEVHWPYPKRFNEMGMTTFGYDGRVLFPLRIVPEAEAVPVKLDLTLDIMVCKDICIPQQLKISHEVDDAAAPQVAIIDASKRKIPKAGGLFDIETVVTGPEAIVLTVKAPKELKDPDVFAYADDVGFTVKPEFTRRDERTMMIKIPKPTDIDDLPKFLSGKDLTIVIVHDNEAIEKTIKL